MQRARHLILFAPQVDIRGHVASEYQKDYSYVCIVHILLSQHDDFTIGALTSLRNYIIRFLSNMLNIELTQVLREMGVSAIPVFCYFFNL